MATQGLIALAGQTLQCGAIDDLNDTPRVGYCSPFLYVAGDFGHGRAPNAEHLGQEFLRKLDSAAFSAVGRLQQPFDRTLIQQDATRCMPQ
jgi:hypothetical protein